MSINKFILSDQSRYLYEQLTDDAEALQYFSGTLREGIATQGTNYNSLWVSCAVRSGGARVTVNYTTATSAVYEVTVGHPLFIETEVGDIGLTVGNVEVEPLAGASCDLDFAVFKGARAVTGLPPQENLVFSLNAAAGVTTDGNGVTSWRDTDGSHVATDPFNAVPLAQPQVVTMDPDFGQRTSLEFDGSGQGLTYSGPVSDFDGFQTFEKLTFIVVHKPDSTADTVGSIFSNLDAGEGWDIRMSSRYLPQGVYNDGSTNLTIGAANEPIERAMVTFIYIDKQVGGDTNGSRNARNQGSTNGGTHNSSAGTGAVDAAVVGDTPAGGQPYSGKIVEILCYADYLDTDTTNQFLTYAADRYLVDDTFYTNFSSFSSMYLTAQRGLTTIAGVPLNIVPESIGASVTDGFYNNQNQLATTGSGTGLQISFQVQGGQVIVSPDTGRIDIPGDGHAVDDIIDFVAAAPGEVRFRITEVAEGVTAWANQGPGSLTEFTNTLSGGGPLTPVLRNSVSTINNQRRVQFGQNGDFNTATRCLTSVDTNLDWDFLGLGEDYVLMLVTRPFSPAEDSGQALSTAEFGPFTPRGGILFDINDRSNFTVVDQLTNRANLPIGTTNTVQFRAVFVQYTLGDTLTLDHKDLGGPETGGLTSPQGSKTVDGNFPLRLGCGSTGGTQGVGIPFYGEIVELVVIKGQLAPDSKDDFFDWFEEKYGGGA